MSSHACRRVLFLSALFSLLLTAPNLTTTLDSQRAAARPTKPKDPGSYNVVVETSQAGGGSTWTYTISKTTPITTDLGHFIVNFNNCGDRSPALTSIVSATVNGVDWLNHVEASEGKTGCAVDSTNFVKFDDLPPADTHVIQFTLDDIYPTVETTGWLKAGTTCTRRPLLGPGCKGYLRSTAMDADASLAGMLDEDINGT